MLRKALIGLPTVFLAVIGLVSLLSSGQLEPTAPPGPTFKTLDEIPPTWSQALPASERYVLVLNGAGVLDKETGLVWEQSPLNPFSSLQVWATAVSFCRQQIIGVRFGSRLPTIEELASVTGNGRKLPSGHPFDVDCSDNRCVGNTVYWTASTMAADATHAVVLNVLTGGFTASSKTGTHPLWCVRGGHGVDAGH